MLSPLQNQLIKKVLADIRSISHAACSLWDMDGKCISSEGCYSEQLEETVRCFVKTRESFVPDESFFGNEALFVIRHEETPVYVLHLKGDGIDLALTGRLVSSQFNNLICAVYGKPDKNQFVKSLLSNELHSNQIQSLAKKLRVDLHLPRVVLLIESRNQEKNLIFETANCLVSAGLEDHVIEMKDGNIALVKTLRNKESYDEVEKFARVLVDTLETETMMDIRISFGMIVKELDNLHSSYLEAMAAMEIGRVFYADRTVLSYKKLGIGRLIHQLPTSVCKMFLDEALGGIRESALDSESLATIYAFFANNLNISETARHLFVHRNTLAYRLDKIQKKTGLDIRNFDDAVTLKLALMVGAHLRGFIRN